MFDSATPWTVAHQASQSFILSLILLKFICTKLCWWCYLTISSSAAPFSFFLNLSQHQGRFQWVGFFTNELTLCIRWPKYLSFSFSPSSKYWRLISFRINWFDLTAVQRTFKSLLQHHNLKVSILRRKHSFPGASVVKNLSAIQATQACPWVRKIPWRWNWQSTPVFLPGKSHGQGSLASYNPWGSKRVGHNWAIKQQRLYANGHTQKISALIDTGVSAEVTKNGKTIGLSNSIFLLLFNEQILLMK